MSMSRSTKTSFMYSLHKTILKTVPNHPYLGALFSEDLKWSNHINNISKKANSTLGFLRRNLRRCPTTCKRTAYLALVRPLLEYGAIVWDPNLKQDIEKLERVQRGAARFISRNYRTTTPGFVTGLLDKYNLPTLQNRRQHLRLTFFYKVVEGLVPAVPPDLFLTPQRPGRRICPSRSLENYVTTNPVNNYIRRNDRCYIIPNCKTEQYKQSFFPRTIIAWNQLENSAVHSTSVESFKGTLKVNCSGC